MTSETEKKHRYPPVGLEADACLYRAEMMCRLLDCMTLPHRDKALLRFTLAEMMVGLEKIAVESGMPR